MRVRVSLLGCVRVRAAGGGGCARPLTHAWNSNNWVSCWAGLCRPARRDAHRNDLEGVKEKVLQSWRLCSFRRPAAPQGGAKVNPISFCTFPIGR